MYAVVYTSVCMILHTPVSEHPTSTSHRAIGQNIVQIVGTRYRHRYRLSLDLGATVGFAGIRDRPGTACALNAGHTRSHESTDE